jgi:hypothetical protein
VIKDFDATKIKPKKEKRKEESEKIKTHSMAIKFIEIGERGFLVFALVRNFEIYEIVLSCGKRTFKKICNHSYDNKNDYIGTLLEVC